MTNDDQIDEPTTGSSADTPETEEATLLRQRAELTISERVAARLGTDATALAPATLDATRLIHELQVYQIELELQNERLKESRDEAERLRRRYTDLYDFAPTGYITASVDGTMKESNRAAEQLLARERGALRGKRLGAFVIESERASFNDFLAQVFADEAPASCELAIGHDARSARIVAVEGVRSADRSECLLSLMDVTLRRRAEAALRLRDRAVRAITQGFLITDPHQAGHPIIYANPGFEAMTGYSAMEIVGRNCRFLQGAGTDRSVVRQIREAIAAERPISVEILNYRKDGTPFWNALSITPVRDDQGRLLQFIGVQTDVTAHRETERALRQAQRLEAVGRLAGGVAQDFNNLLTVINGNAELLLSDTNPDDPRFDIIRAVGIAGERAATLTHQLLAFSRSQMLDPTVLDVAAVVKGIASTLKQLLGPQRELLLQLDTDPLLVRIDAAQLGQVLVNLVANARDAMPSEGSVTIRTSRVVLALPQRLGHEELAPGAYVLVTVTDTGIGMDAMTAARAFEPFFSTKGTGQGAGLGLAMVYGLVKQSGGYVALDSAPMQGSTFILYLPAVSMRGPSITPEATRRQSERGQETILLVHDEDTELRQLAQTVLSQQGYTLIHGDSLAAALAVLTAHPGPIDLLVASLGDNETALLQLLAQARELRPNLRCLLLTKDATGAPDDAPSLPRLAKPFSPVTLTRFVRAVLDGDGAQPDAQSSLSSGDNGG